MLNYLQRIKFLVQTLLILFLIYAVCRILFFLFNAHSFQGISFAELAKLCYHGLKFDLSAICFSNAVFFLLVLFPYNLLQIKLIKKITAILFIVVNAVCMLANCSDFVYFKFIAKRTTFDVFHLMLGGQTDFISLLPAFVIDYWYVFIICLLLVVFMWKAYKYIEQKHLQFKEEPKAASDFFLRVITFGLCSGLVLLGMRGGMQLIPIGMVNAGDRVENKYIPIVLNTPFSIMKSAELNTLQEFSFFSEQELKKIVSPVKNACAPNVKQEKQNVVVLILESFSKEYTFLGKRKSYTPFLDSLMKEGLFFTNAFSNGKRSIEGIPAILAGMPSFSEAYLNTVYNSNKINSLANLLQKQGYSSSFFHGGTNGTMSFNSFCALAGFNKYYGRYEYNNELDYDGHWGIWDEPFLKYYATQLATMQQPFISSVFTLSSHHPFQVPEKYKSKFPEGTLPIHKCIAYTDYSLQQFFKSIQQQAWFKHTLFVITADHTGLSDDPFYNNAVGNYEIPLLFYAANGSLKGIDSNVVQQIDIMPSVLDYLNYPHPYFAFGNSVFRKENKERFAINMSNNLYQLYTNNFLLLFDGKKSTGCYNYKSDSLLQKNVYQASKEQNELEKKMKAFLQQYNHSLIHNTTTIP